MNTASILASAIFLLNVFSLSAQEKKASKPLVRFSNPPALSQPTRYSHVAEVLAGRLVFISGQVSEDAKGNVIGKGDIRVQTRQVMMNLKAALQAVGGDWSNVVKMNTYLTDSSNIAAFREAREEMLANVKPRPASTAIVMTKLFGNDYLVEIDVVAVVPEKPLPTSHSGKDKSSK
jgi:enamine deaminase RidA (YjgF/YER057c/UK114 family)